jgi:hypothetical protein
MRKNIITGVSLVALSADMARAGGFELQTLDTSIMYAGGNTGSISIADINASVSGTVLRLTPLRINASRILVSKWMLVSLIWGRKLTVLA